MMSGAFLALAIVLLALAPAAVPPNAFGDEPPSGPPPPYYSKCPNPTVDNCDAFSGPGGQFGCELFECRVSATWKCLCKWDATKQTCFCPN